MAGEFDLADVGGLSRGDVEKDIDLLGSGVGSAFGRDARAVVAVLLHELANVLQGTIEFVKRMQLAELKLGRIHDLVGVGVVWGALHVDGSDKEIERGDEGKQHIGARGSYFGLDVGKASGGEEDADAFADVVAVERLAWFLREHLEQVIAVRYAREFD